MPWRERFELAEISVELLLAQLRVRVLPFRALVATYCPGDRGDAPPPPLDSTHDIRLALHVRTLVTRALAWQPVPVLCLGQALAAAAYLRRRGRDVRLYLGTTGPTRGFQAHAWLSMGDIVVTGGREAASFTAVASFVGAGRPQLPSRSGQGAWGRLHRWATQALTAQVTRTHPRLEPGAAALARELGSAQPCGPELLALLDTAPPQVASELRPLLGQAWEAWTQHGATAARVPTQLDAHRRAQALQRLRTQGMMQQVARIVRALKQADAEAMLLKGGALVAAWVSDPATRDMADIDLLVRFDRFPRACETLEHLGGTRRERLTSVMRAHPEHAGHALSFAFESGLIVDLHYCALDLCRWPGADDALWERARRVSIGGELAALVPSAADLLVLVLAHGFRKDRGVMRWPGDAALLILRGAEPVDWEVVVQEAGARKLRLPLLLTLGYLQREGLAPVPQEARAALTTLPAAWWEAVDTAVRTRWHNHERGHRLGAIAGDYLRFQLGQGRSASLGGLVTYLGERWGATTPRAFVYAAWSKVQGVCKGTTGND